MIIVMIECISMIIDVIVLIELMIMLNKTVAVLTKVMLTIFSELYFLLAKYAKRDSGLYLLRTNRNMKTLLIFYSKWAGMTDS